MCGRLVIYSSTDYFAGIFGVEASFELNPRYNIPPTFDIPVCRVNQQGDREFVQMRWGLVPRLVEGAGQPLFHVQCAGGDGT